MEDKEKLWTKDFVLVIIINFLVFLNHLMILSTFPFFIERLGYSDTVSGACATAFSLVAVLARPFVGWLLDTGRRRVLLGVGLIGMALMPMGYLLIYTALASLALAILLRMVHGLSLACANTSTSTMATDILPRSRFSEGMGMFGMATALATACAPAIGEALMKRGFGALFGVAAGCMVLSLVLLFCLRTKPLPRVKTAAPGRFSRTVGFAGVCGCVDFFVDLWCAGKLYFEVCCRTARNYRVRRTVLYGYGGTAVSLSCDNRQIGGQTGRGTVCV